jgi:hypothetical protein
MPSVKPVQRKTEKEKEWESALLLRSGYFSLFSISLTLHFILKERRTFINRFSSQLMHQFVTIRPPSNTFHRTKQLAVNTSAMKLLVVSSDAGCAKLPSLTLNAYEGSISGLKRPGSETNHLPLSSAEIKNCWNYTSWFVQGEIYRLLSFTKIFIAASQETKFPSISKTSWLIMNRCAYHTKPLNAFCRQREVDFNVRPSCTQELPVQRLVKLCEGKNCTI